MAISGQQTINIGLPNNPANSDSLYTAFNAIQDNFTTVFANGSPITAITAGNGVSISNSVTSYQITNSGVTSITAGTNVIISSSLGGPGSTGDLVISATGSGGGGTGTVSSVGVSSSSLTVTNSPIITSGVITVDIPTQSIVAGSYTNPSVTVSNKGIVTAISNGASSSGTVTSVNINPGAGIETTGGPITTSGNITVINTGVTSLVAGTGISVSGANGAVTISSTGGGSGGGTVTRVGLTSSSMTVTSSPVVTSGDINIELPATINATTLVATTANLTTINTSTLNARSSSNAASPIISFSATATTDTLTYSSARSRGTLSSPAAILSSDDLLKMRGGGYTGFGIYQAAGALLIRANGTASSSSSYIPSDVLIHSTTASSIISFTFSNTGNLVIPGVFVGSGSGLNSLTGANVTGAVANATYAVTAGTANAVAGANVTGAVANATYAVTSGVANSVAGANVTGTVANATNAGALATTLTSTGTVYIPFISASASGNYPHLSNASFSANLANGAITATTFVGALSGAATTAGTVTTAAQANITSVGTLTSLEVSGTANIGNLRINDTSTANTVATVTRLLPINVGGTLYNIMLTA